MKKIFSPDSLRAIEERFANARATTYQPAGKFEKLPHIRYGHRVSAFNARLPLLSGDGLSAGALLAAIAELAANLYNSHAPKYRVRSEPSTSARSAERCYVPACEFELHFCALDRWLDSIEHRNTSEALARTGVLNPLVQRLLDAAVIVRKGADIEKNCTHDELQHLTDQQKQRNLIAKKVQDWVLGPTHKASVIAWQKKHAATKNAFLSDWTAAANRQKSSLYRGEFLAKNSSGLGLGFPAHQNIGDVADQIDAFRKAVSKHPNTAGCHFLVQTYLGQHKSWVHPWILLAPQSAAFTCQQAVHDCWLEVSGSSRTVIADCDQELNPHFRITTDDQRQFESIEEQLLSAAVYFFDTLLIADSRLETIQVSKKIRNQLYTCDVAIENMVKPTASHNETWGDMAPQNSQFPSPTKSVI